MMAPATQFVSNELEQCVGDIPDITKGSNTDKLRSGKVSGAKEGGVIECCCFSEPCSCTVKYALEQGAPKINDIVKISFMEYGIFTKFNPVEIGDVVKSRSPKADTLVADRIVEISAPLEDSLAERTGTMKDGFIEIEVCFKEGTPKVHIFLEDDRPEIDNIFKRTPDTREILVEKYSVVFVAFQFGGKDIDDPFDDTIRECNGCRIALECLKENLRFNYLVVLFVHLCLLPWFFILCANVLFSLGAGLKFCQKFGKWVFENGFRFRLHNSMTYTVFKMVNFNIVRI